ncbi:MAG: hypothetical protein A3G81_21355 [Betaproteobacteria bacterium RIFCSPLOWO2_12_FULL_65_14]|nr:MAG: hypothetical protein A3G81_21355 [Betaproteobacteria bacterium RIFCSPLOWO2_12_FULL_65_14]
MSPRIRQVVNDITAALLFGLALALAMPQAYAGMISADHEERARVKTMLERPQLATELERMGIPPQEASARVDAMTPGEVRELAGRLDALAAGGQAGTRDLLLVLLVVLLVLLLI